MKCMCCEIVSEMFVKITLNRTIDSLYRSTYKLLINFADIILLMRHVVA